MENVDSETACPAGSDKVLAGLDARELGDAERGRKGIRGARRRRRLPLGCRHRVPEAPVTTQAPRKHRHIY